jgi:uncharacterized membrane protein YgcG
MKKRLFSLILAAALLLSAAACAQSEADDTRVFDDIGLYTQEQADTLESAIRDFQKQTGYDFAIVIVTNALGYSDYQEMSDAVYQAFSLGMGMSRAAVVCSLDVYEDGTYYLYVSVYGELKYLTDENDLQYLLDNIKGDISDGKLTEGFLWAMNIIEDATGSLASNYSRRVYDFAELLTDEETETIESAIADFRALSGVDFVCLSTDENLDGNDDGDYMVQFYDWRGFGEGDNRSGAMMYLKVDLENSYVDYFLRNFGGIDSKVSQESLEGIIATCGPLMNQNRFADAILQVIEAYSAYFR